MMIKTYKLCKLEDCINEYDFKLVNFQDSALFNRDYKIFKETERLHKINFEEDDFLSALEYFELLRKMNK